MHYTQNRAVRFVRGNDLDGWMRPSPKKGVRLSLPSLVPLRPTGDDESNQGERFECILLSPVGEKMRVVLVVAEVV